jgi:hypothetical protein
MPEYIMLVNFTKGARALRRFQTGKTNRAR